MISVIRNWEISPYYGYWLDRPASVGALIESIAGTITAFVYRGDTNPIHNMPGVPLVQLLEPILLGVGLWTVYNQRHRANYLLILLFFGLGVLPDMWIDGSPDYRWLVILQPILYMILGIGAVEIINIARQQIDYPLKLNGHLSLNSCPAWFYFC